MFALVGFVLLITQGLIYRRLAKYLSEATFMTLGIIFMAREGLTLGRARTLAAEAGEGDSPGTDGVSARSGPAEGSPNESLAGAAR